MGQESRGKKKNILVLFLFCPFMFRTLESTPLQNIGIRVYHFSDVFKTSLNFPLRRTKSVNPVLLPVTGITRYLLGCCLCSLNTWYGWLKLLSCAVFREIPGEYGRLFLDLYMITVTCFFLAWFYSHRDPNIRGRVPSCGEENYLPTHGAQQHWENCRDWCSHR